MNKEQEETIKNFGPLYRTRSLENLAEELCQIIDTENSLEKIQERIYHKFSYEFAENNKAEKGNDLVIALIHLLKHIEKHDVHEKCFTIIGLVFSIIEDTELTEERGMFMLNTLSFVFSKRYE